MKRQFLKSFFLFKPLFAIIILLQVTVSAQETQFCGVSCIKNFLEKSTGALPRPVLSGTELTISTAHFKIHYTFDGQDATTQVWADSVAASAEIARAAFSNSGWLLPPPDGVNGGDSKYDIYIRDCIRSSQRYNGICFPDSSYAPGPYENSYTSWVEIEQDSIIPTTSSQPYPYPKFVTLRAALTHEFHHGCQIAYRGIVDFNSWFYESTSTYMMDQLTGTNFIKYFNELFPSPLRMPEYNITTQDGAYAYAGGLFPKLLNEYYDDNTLRHVWEEFGVNYTSVLFALDQALYNYYSSDLNTALTKYAEWRYFTGHRDDGNHFHNANQLPNYITPINSSASPVYSSYPILNNHTIPLGGARYIRFTHGTLDSLNISFNGEYGLYAWGAELIGYRKPAPSIVSPIPLDINNGIGSRSMSWAGNDTIILVAVNTYFMDGTSSVRSFSYSASQLQNVFVTFVNKVGTQDAGGSLLVNNTDTVQSGNFLTLTGNTICSTKTLASGNSAPDRFPHFQNGATVKHNNWNGTNSAYLLSNDFNVPSSSVPYSQNANFESLHPVTINTSLLDVPAFSGGTLRINDPWYLKSDGSQGSNFSTNYTVPLTATNGLVGAYNQSTGGVFLNQGGSINNWTPPYYSVRAPQTQTNIGGIEGYFQKWSGTNVAYQDSSALHTGVVFQQANATATALYKGHLISSSSKPTRGNGQQRIATTHVYYNDDSGVGEDIAVYESGGEIWTTSHDIAANTWSPEIRISDGMGGNSAPSIAARGYIITPEQFFGDGIYVVWQKQRADSLYDIYMAIRNSYPAGSGYPSGWSTSGQNYSSGVPFKVNSSPCSVPPKPVVTVHKPIPVVEGLHPAYEIVPIVYRQNASTITGRYARNDQYSIFSGAFRPIQSEFNYSLPSSTYQIPIPGLEFNGLCFNQPEINSYFGETVTMAYVDFSYANGSLTLKTVDETSTGVYDGIFHWSTPQVVPASDGRPLYVDPYSWWGEGGGAISIYSPQVLRRWGKTRYSWIQYQAYESPYVPFIVYQDRIGSAWNQNIYAWALLNVQDWNILPTSVALGDGYDETTLMWSVENTIYKTVSPSSNDSVWQTMALQSNGQDPQMRYFGSSPIGSDNWFSLYTEPTASFQSLKAYNNYSTQMGKASLAKTSGIETGSRRSSGQGKPVNFSYSRTLTVTDTAEGTQLSITVTQPKMGTRALSMKAVNNKVQEINAENCL